MNAWGQFMLGIALAGLYIPTPLSPVWLHIVGFFASAMLVGDAIATGARAIGTAWRKGQADSKKAEEGWFAEQKREREIKSPRPKAPGADKKKK